MATTTDIYFSNEWSPIDEGDIDKLQLSKSDLNNLTLRKIISYNSKSHFHYWSMIGFIIIHNTPVVIFPEQYKPDSENLKSAALLLLSVFRKYSTSSSLTSEEMEYLYGNDGNKDSQVALSMYFFEDFRNHGIIKRTRNKLTTNEVGHVNWNQTINKQMPLIAKNRAVYASPFIKKTEFNNNSQLTKLHEYILHECTNNWGWLDDFAYTTDTDFPFDSIASATAFLKQELRATYLQREIMLLKNMISYLQNNNDDDDYLVKNYFYTPYFHRIWEKMCKVTFDDEYDKLSKKYIPKTFWNFKDSPQEPKELNQIPDILCIRNNKFCILDAKYYKKEELPHWSDVMKQYIYYVSIKGTAQEYKDNICNAFLFPGDNNKVECFATIETPQIENTVGTIYAYRLKVEDIMKIYLEKPDTKAWKDYYKKEVLDNLQPSKLNAPS